jgi:hypothetical protein
MGEGGGGIGDIYVERIDGQAGYTFAGVPGELHRLYEQGDLRVYPRIMRVPHDTSDPPKTYLGGVDVLVGDVHLVVLPDGKTHVFARGFHWEIEAKFCTLDQPGHFGNTQNEWHPLQGVPHFNVRCAISPDDRPGESGLMVDPSPDDNPERFVVHL